MDLSETAAKTHNPKIHGMVWFDCFQKMINQNLKTKIYASYDDLFGKLFRNQASVEPKGPTIFIRRRKKCVGLCVCRFLGVFLSVCVFLRVRVLSF